METRTFTYFTYAGSQPTSVDNLLVYSAEDWAQVRLRLDSVGPASASTRQDLFPIGSKGILLSTEWAVMILPPGSRLYIGADTLQRVAVVAEPIPYMSSVIQLLNIISGTPAIGKPSPPPWPLRF